MTTSMPMPPLMAHPSLSGHRLVAGLWFPADWFDEATRRRLLMRCWRQGAIACSFQAGDLLRFQQAVLMDCDGLPGWPLVADGAGLSSAAPVGLDTAVGRRADVWLVTGGQPVPLDWRDSALLDPSEWLDIHAFTLHDTLDWSETVAQPQATPTVVRPIREVLNGKVGEPSPAQQEFLRALHSRTEAKTKSDTSAQKRAPGTSPRLVSDSVLRVWRTLRLVGGGLLLMGALATLADAAQSHVRLPWAEMAAVIMGGVVWWWVRRHLGGRREVAGRALGAGAARAGGAGGVAAGRVLPARRTAWVPSRWRALAERMAILSRFSRVIGMKQARYMQRMLGMFESGDLDEALKHAIPLGAKGEAAPAALTEPTPRQKLDLHGGQGATSRISVGDDLESHLRQIYRKTFEQLKRQQRVDEAVYVLAVLLNARQEALDYLESEGRLAQAAELALSWDQPPDVLVRLHCLVGDWRKAVAIARRDKAFAGAVRQLEGKWPQAAARLRGEWGEALVQQGQWTAAIDAVWPVPEMREQAVRWLEEAQQAGGHVGARALVQRAVLLPDTLGQQQALLVALRDDPAFRVERAAMARALLDERQRAKGVQVLAGMILPMLLHDVATGGAQVDTKSLQDLVNLSDDRFLQADLPAGWPKASQLDWRTHPFDEQAPEPGAHAIADAVALPGGGWLVALGEAGAVVCDAQGRRLHRFDAPADVIVAGDSAQNALVLRRRESLWRVSRLDLVRREVHELGMLKADTFARNFDGIAWTVSRGRELLVLDTGHDLSEVLWHVGDLPGQLLGLAADSQHEQLLFAPGEGDGEESPELWSYALPSRRLVQRDTVGQLGQGGTQLLHPRLGLISLRQELDANGRLTCAWKARGTRAFSHLFEVGVEEVMQACVGTEWLLLAGRGEHGLSIKLLTFDANCLGTVHWPMDERLRIRWAEGGGFMLFDSQGRLMRLDPWSRQITSAGFR